MQGDSGILGVFQPVMDAVRTVVHQYDTQGKCRTVLAGTAPDWPVAGPRDIVLLPDLAVELGPPEEASAAFLVWTGDDGLVCDNTIRLIGPDVGETQTGQLPFGKVVLVRTRPVDDETSYRNYLNLDLARFEVSLKGYMLRAASQQMREWARISRDAVTNGFSLHILGAALIKALKTRPEVLEAEVMFATSPDVVRALIDPCRQVSRLIGAMTRMVEEDIADCSSCDYQDICRDAAGMQALRKSLSEKRQRERIKTP
jgi:CO dehydrogenase/acetyl-CoA synthase beta subunit